jgi:hypothetical protein
MRAPGSAPVARLGCTTRSRPRRNRLAASSAKKRAWPAAVVVCRTLTMRVVNARARGSLYSSVQPSQRAAVQARSCDERSCVAIPATNARLLFVTCRDSARTSGNVMSSPRPSASAMLPSQPRGCACRLRATPRKARGLADERERDQVARERGEIDARSAVALRDRIERAVWRLKCSVVANVAAGPRRPESLSAVRTADRRQARSDREPWKDVSKWGGM